MLKNLQENQWVIREPNQILTITEEVLNLKQLQLSNKLKECKLEVQLTQKL